MFSFFVSRLWERRKNVFLGSWTTLRPLIHWRDAFSRSHTPSQTSRRQRWNSERWLNWCTSRQLTLKWFQLFQFNFLCNCVSSKRVWVTAGQNTSLFLIVSTQSSHSSCLAVEEKMTWSYIERSFLVCLHFVIVQSYIKIAKNGRGKNLAWLVS